MQQGIITGGNIPPELLQGMQNGQIIAKPVIPKQVEEKQKEHMQHAKILSDRLGNYIQDMNDIFEGAEMPADTMAHILFAEALKFLVDERVPIEVSVL